MRLVTIFFLLCMSGCVSSDGSRTCSFSDERKAEEHIDNIKSWQGVYALYVKYPECDDGAIAYGASDAIVKLFLKKPNAFESYRVKGNFEAFVLSHINETMILEEGKLLQKMARDCNMFDREFCYKLLRRLKE